METLGLDVLADLAESYYDHILPKQMALPCGWVKVNIGNARHVYVGLPRKHSNYTQLVCAVDMLVIASSLQG